MRPSIQANDGSYFFGHEVAQKSMVPTPPEVENLCGFSICFSCKITRARDLNMLKADTRDDLAADSSPGCSSTVDLGRSSHGKKRHHGWTQSATSNEISYWLMGSYNIKVTWNVNVYLECTATTFKCTDVWIYELVCRYRTYVIHDPGDLMLKKGWSIQKETNKDRRSTPTPGVPHILSEALDPCGRHLSELVDEGWWRMMKVDHSWIVFFLHPTAHGSEQLSAIRWSTRKRSYELWMCRFVRWWQLMAPLQKQASVWQAFLTHSSKSFLYRVALPAEYGSYH